MGAGSQSLLNWCTPERRSGDRILPIIPNEIYLDVLDHVAPSTGLLEAEELEMFTNLSRVCRFFANICLPRVFESLEFSGTIHRDDTPAPAALRNGTVYKTSRESALCSQIASRKPLSLALAKMVKSCHFTGWTLDQTGSWAVQLFSKKYLDGMVHMVNIREVKFSESFVDTEHWDAISTLCLLEELSFDRCTFLCGPADAEPGKWVKIKVTRFRLTGCQEDRQPLAAVDPSHLGVVTMDSKLLDQADFLSLSALTELHFRPPHPYSHYAYTVWLRQLFERAPRSLQSLYLCIKTIPFAVPSIVRSMFGQHQWRNFPLLRSLTLQFSVHPLPKFVISSVLGHIRHRTHLRSFTLESCIDDNGGTASRCIPPTERLRIVREQLGSDCNMQHAVIYDTAFRRVDGEWTMTTGSSAIPSR